MTVPALPGVGPHARGSSMPRDMASMMEPVKTGAGASDRLLLAPGFQFFSRHWPSNWQVSQTLDEPTLLPEISKFPLQPGINGVRTIGTNEDEVKAYQQAVWKAQAQGWVFISPADDVPTDCLPEGVPPGSYLRGLKCEHPLTNVKGKHYVEAWSVPLATPPGEDQEFRWDLASYERWLLWLVQSGQIEPPRPSVVAKLINRAGGHVDNARNSTANPELKARYLESRLARLAKAEAAAKNVPTADVADQSGEIAALQAELAKLQAAAPKKQRKRGKPADPPPPEPLAAK